MIMIGTTEAQRHGANTEKREIENQVRNDMISVPIGESFSLPSVNSPYLCASVVNKYASTECFLETAPGTE